MRAMLMLLLAATAAGCASRGVVPVQTAPEDAVRVYVETREGSALYGRPGRVIGWFDQDECDGIVGIAVPDAADYRLIFDAPSGLLGTGTQVYLTGTDGRTLAELTALSGRNNVKDACVAIRSGA